MKRVVGISLMFSLARAIPLRSATQALDIRNANLYIDTGEPTKDRSLFTVFSMVSVMILSLLLGSRFTRLKRNIMTKRSLTSVFVFTLYILALLFTMISAVLVAGQGLYTHALCVAGTWVCLMFYTLIKAVIYIFLVERIHVVRAPFVNRRKDKIYIGCMTMVVIMYSSTAINSYVNNVTEMHDEDGRCHFGIRGIVSIPFTVVNFFTDLVLTGVFFYLLRPVAHIPGLPIISTIFGKREEQEKRNVHGGNDTPVRKNIRTLLWKSIIGSLLIEIPMAANMIQFVVTKGEELGMICLTLCLVDVVWDALVIHWLTFGSSGAAAERDLSRSLATSSDQSLGPHSRLTPSRQSDQSDVKGTTQQSAEELTDVRVGAMEFVFEGRRDSTASLVKPLPCK